MTKLFINKIFIVFVIFPSEQLMIQTFTIMLLELSFKNLIASTATSVGEGTATKTC